MKRSGCPWAWTLPVVVSLMFIWGCAHDGTDVIDPGGAALAVGAIRGTVTSLGAPLPGVRVRTVPHTIEVLTDAVGRYELPGLHAQTLQVVMDATGFVTNSTTVSVIAGRTVVHDVALRTNTGAGRIRGIITDGELPLERVLITTEPRTQSFITEQTGLYDFPGLTPGVYTVDAFRVGFDRGRLRLTVVEQGLVEGDMSLGRRTDAVIVGTVRDEVGNPINGAFVELFHDDGAQWTTTGPDGTYWFTNLRTGFIVIGVTATNYYPGSRSLEVWGGVPVNGDVILTLTSSLPPLPGAVAGTVWDDQYRPLANAVVTLEPESSTPRIELTDQEGRYFFTNVPTGTRVVTASSPGYALSSKTVSVGISVTADASFVLKWSS